jgi:two-component system chemotaxis sensor kinase CheA
MPDQRTSVPAEVPEGLEDVYLEFLSEAREILDGLDDDLIELEKGRQGQKTLESAFRRMHTLKGAAGFLNLGEIQAVAHKAEDDLAEMRRDGVAAVRVRSVLAALDVLRNLLFDDAGGSPDSRPVRVEGSVLDRLLELSGEISARRHVLLSTAEGAAGFGRLVDAMRNTVLRARVQPVGDAFGRLPRIVRDASVQVGKKVELVLHGKEVEIDRSLLEPVGDVLVHLLRNAVDHGVETPQERSAAGKRDLATIEVRAYHSVDGVVIEVTDDGRGIDTDRVKTIAVERGIVDHARVSGLSEAEIVELLFLPGFSTAGSAGLLSGRGVGMDVVRTTVEAAGGSVTVESRRGSGTTVLLHLPSTLLGMPVLSFRAGGYNCMFSRSFVERVVDAEEFLSVAGKPVYRTGELLVPVLDLGTVLGSQGSRGPGVLCRVGTSLVVFRVSSVEGVIETLVRPIDILLRGEGIYSGMSLTDLGVPSLLLDPAGLLRRAGSGAAPARPAQEPAGEPTALAPGRKERGLVCSDGPALYVIPEAHVARVIRNPSLRSVHAHAGLFVLDGAPLKVRRPDGTETALPGILIHMEGRSCAVTVDEVHGFADLASTRSSGSTRLLETPEGVAIVLDPSDIFSSDVEWVRS